MSAPPRREDRTRLDGFELEIFRLVRERATSKQWREWLRAPLEHATAKGDMDLFTRLMDAGADGSAGWRGCDGQTLLGAACGAPHKSEEMVLALLQAGSKNDVNVTFGAKQESALHVAAHSGEEKVANTLMLAGANPNALNVYTQSPLHLAAEAGHEGTVVTLMLKGALPSTKVARSGGTPLHLAAEWGHAQCVSKLVIGGADPDSLNIYGATPLHLAVRNNRLRAVEELLAAGASLHIRETIYPGYSALDIAARRGHADVVRVLLAHGCSVSLSDAYGCTALHYAAYSGNILVSDNSGVVRMLLEAGADTDGGLETPLQIETRMGPRSTMCALLEGGANVNACSSDDGHTPLHEACHESNVGAVELLLRWGADEKLLDTAGSTVYDVLGAWEEEGVEGDSDYNEERKANDQRIRHMLERAPADRSWRRRRWLVLARSCPAKVHLTFEGDSGGGGSGSGNCVDARGGGKKRTGDQTRNGLEHLVSSVVGLYADEVFRLVVGFL